MTPQNNAKNPARVYSNLVLTVIAGLLAVMALDPRRGESSFVDQAQAQPVPGNPDNSGAGLISAADQRKQMIAEMRSMTTRLERIESVLRGGLNVKVTEMPSEKR